MSTLRRLKYTTLEGGQWQELMVHSIEMPDGSQWDAVNGWRKRLEMAPLCIGWTTLDELCRKPHMVDAGPGLIAADDLLADPPVRASAIEAWPSEDEVIGLIVEHIGYQGPILASATAHVICERFKYAAPPAQGSAGRRLTPALERLMADHLEAAIKRGYVSSWHIGAMWDAIRIALAPPVEAQDSAGWRPSDDDLRAGVRAFQSTPHGPDYLADWRAFYEAVRALAPPVEAQGSSPAEATSKDSQMLKRIRKIVAQRYTAGAWLEIASVIDGLAPLVEAEGSERMPVFRRFYNAAVAIEDHAKWSIDHCAKGVGHQEFKCEDRADWREYQAAKAALAPWLPANSP